MAAKKIISVVGYMDVDLYMTTFRIPDPGESLQAKDYTSSPGGKGANAAIAAFRSSHVKEYHPSTGVVQFKSPFPEIDIEVRMIGAVGNDVYGRQAKDSLIQSGVDVSGVKTFEDELTGICFCMINPENGENRLLFTTGATDRLMPRDFLSADQLGNGVAPDLIISQLEVRVEAVEQMLKTAYQAGIDVVLNAAPARQIMLDAYEYVTHLIVNETEAAILAGLDFKDVRQDTWQEIAEDLLDLGAKNVVITLGAQGAYYANKREHGRVPAERVPVKDTTGAGDTFVGAYATEYLRQKSSGQWKNETEWDIQRAVAQGNRASAHTICKVGAQATIPWADAIFDFSGDPTIDGYSKQGTEGMSTVSREW